MTLARHNLCGHRPGRLDTCARWCYVIGSVDAKSLETHGVFLPPPALESGRTRSRRCVEGKDMPAVFLVFCSLPFQLIDQGPAYVFTIFNALGVGMIL